MTPTEREIQFQINKESNNFNNSIYKGEVPIPANIIQLFKAAIWALPTFAHKINFHKVRSIRTKYYKELTITELNDAIKVVMNVPIEKLYPANTEFEVMEEDQIKFGDFVKCYNGVVEDFSSALKLKRDNLLLLSGVNHNGMRPIPQA